MQRKLLSEQDNVSPHGFQSCVMNWAVKLKIDQDFHDPNAFVSELVNKMQQYWKKSDIWCGTSLGQPLLASTVVIFLHRNFLSKYYIWLKMCQTSFIVPLAFPAKTPSKHMTIWTSSAHPPPPPFDASQYWQMWAFHLSHIFGQQSLSWPGINILKKSPLQCNLLRNGLVRFFPIRTSYEHTNMIYWMAMESFQNWIIWEFIPNDKLHMTLQVQ